MGSWVGMTNLIFCNGYNASTFFKSSKEIFSMQGGVALYGQFPSLMTVEKKLVGNSHTEI
jgi:hypothetical protein